MAPGFMRNLFGLLSACSLGVGLFAAGCATQINSEEQLVLISSSPLAAKATVDDRFVLTTPGRVNLHRLGEHTILLEKDGYEPQVITTERKTSKLILLNMLCVFFWWYCFERDLKEGGWYRFEDEYHVTLAKPGQTPSTDLESAATDSP
jgi:hypothetical protein